ncbi:uncharacterized protein LOC134819574 [Bolinopsis microptera]|uniref:uncharacterized protein LOC134819574 n=1 Tax=Bolinopsis microptera TaxID=2820187 RepID=UPI00307AA644
MLGALCLALLLQCTMAQEAEDMAEDQNSVNAIFERIEDYADTLDLDTDKDEFFWDEEYWMLPFQHVMKCPDGHGWEGDFTNGHCKPCSAGHFADDDDFGLKSRCIPCPSDEFEDGQEQGYCYGYCNVGTTFQVGSTQESDCVDPDEMFGEGSFQSEVSVEVDMTGDWSFLNDILKEASGISFYEAKAFVEYDEKDHFSKLQVRAMLPNNVAVHAHGFLLKFKAYKDSINDYASLADHYTRIVFDMLNNAETFKEFGWKMNHDQLRVKDEEILSVDVHLNQHCEDGYRSAEWEGVGTKCVKDNTNAPSLKKSVFIQYVGKSQDCMSLGGEARLRDFVQYNWPFPCLESDECEAHFTTCNTLISGECAIMIHLIFYDDDAGQGTVESNLDKAKDVEYYDGESFEYSEENSYKFRDSSECGADPKIDSDGSFKCSESCDSESGYRLTKSGNCQKCPYSTWFDINSESNFPRCHSCGFYQSVTVFDNVPKSAEGCLNGGYTREKNSDGVWGGYGASIDADIEYEVNANIEMYLCEFMEVKQRFENFCSDKFSLEDMSLDDFTDYNLEMLGCLVMEEFSEIHEHSCKDFDRSWSDIMNDFEWEDVACFVTEGIYKIDEKGQNCENLSDDEKRLTMSFDFSEYLSDTVWANGFYLPLFSQVGKMERFQMDTVSKTVEGAFRKFGMYEMTKLTGLEMMDHMRDMILSIPRGLRITNGALTTLDISDILCENGNVKLHCSDDSCRSCKNNADGGESADDAAADDAAADDGSGCYEDGCNNCQAVWPSSVECEPECEVQHDIDNGRLIKISDNDWVENQLCEGCNNIATTYRYSCEEGYRLDNLGGGDDVCNIAKVYCKTTDNTINRQPNCVRDTCVFRELENGYIAKKHADLDSPCRYAEYECDPGYEMEGERMVSCSLEDDQSDMPRCVKAECQFPEELENARLVGEYVNWEGSRRGWYQCLDGTRDYDDIYVRLECRSESQSTGCEKMYDCPSVIENGYLMREWEWNSEYEQEYTYIGEYRCNPGFELRNAKIFSASEEDYKEKYGWGKCIDGENNTPDPENLPRCVRPDSPEPCNMPEKILNGYRVEEIKNEIYDIVDQARYRCNSGYMMSETWKGDIGWCRSDRTFELPYCVDPKDWYTIEFELVSGFSKMENAGRVRGRHNYADGSSGDWYAGCDDHFNGPAAGAICRSMGFRHGKQIKADKKMKPISDLPFGITNIFCYHDDTLIMSPSCNADKYGQLGWPICTPEEQIAVHCFNEMWKVDVGFSMVERSGKMFCPVKVLKEGKEMKLKNMDVRVEWGGVHLESGDDYKTEYFKEGVHYTTNGKFSLKKGFKARFTGDKKEYDCFFCDIYMNDQIMNPWPDKNHNCPTEYSEDDDMKEDYNGSHQLLFWEPL